MGEVRVLIVDDQEPFRRAASTVVELADTFRVVGTAASGEECLSVIDELNPDLVLLDVNLPGIDGIETCRRLRERVTPPKVILVSTYLEAEFEDARTVGALAYIEKSAFGPDTLTAAWTSAVDRAAPGSS